MSKNNKIAVLGAGSWGTAFAIHAASLGFNACIFTRFNAQLEEINVEHSNNEFLPEIKLDSKITASQSVNEVLKDAVVIFLVIPAQNIRGFLEKHGNNFTKDQFVLIGSKGIENGSLKFMDQVVAEYIDSNIGILSGPNFAIEIAQTLPTTSLIACSNLKNAQYYSNLLSSENFKCESSTDVTGTQILGSLKNVLAIGCGICQGSKLGDNFTASLFNLGITEISKLLEKLGGQQETIFSPAGIGDLFLTCSSTKSRNYSLGLDLGSGKQNITEILNRTQLAEGFKSASSVNDIIVKHKISLPLFVKIYKILFNQDNIESLKMIFNE